MSKVYVRPHTKKVKKKVELIDGRQLKLQKISPEMKRKLLKLLDETAEKENWNIKSYLTLKKAIENGYYIKNPNELVMDIGTPVIRRDKLYVGYGYTYNIFDPTKSLVIEIPKSDLKKGRISYVAYKVFAR